MSTSSCHGDTDVDHFLSASCTGRRVSFNEAAIYEQSAKDQEKGRRSDTLMKVKGQISKALLSLCRVCLYSADGDHMTSLVHVLV